MDGRYDQRRHQRSLEHRQGQMDLPGLNLSPGHSPTCATRTIRHRLGQRTKSLLCPGLKKKNETQRNNKRIKRRECAAGWMEA